MATVIEDDTGGAAAQADDVGTVVVECHKMLLRLAGRLPDDLITRCREELAQGALGELARAVVFCVLSQGLPLASADAEVLSLLLDEAGADPSALSEVEINDSDPVNWYFTDERRPAVDVNSGQGEDRDASAATEKLDQAMAEALADEADAVGCWRAWRVAGDRVPSAEAKAVFVVEIESDADLAGVTTRLQRRLADAGEASPQVEVYPWDLEPPAYQREARGWGELIWAVAEDSAMQVASIFDEVDAQSGPWFSPDHPQLDSEEAAKVARYLSEAEPVLVTSALMDDVVDTSRQYCVPLNFRTDGTWIWTEASAYYAQEHLLEPDPDLLAHIRSNHHTVPDVDGRAVQRALEVLQQPPESEPVWTFNGSPDEEASEEVYGDDIIEEVAFGRTGRDAFLDDEPELDDGDLDNELIKPARDAGESPDDSQDQILTDHS